MSDANNTPQPDSPAPAQLSQPLGRPAITVPADVSRKLLTFIQTRDKKAAKYDWRKDAISRMWTEFLAHGAIVVGGRASCGRTVDPTWVKLCLWKEVVEKARRLGIGIDVERVPQGNSWATKSGGFWEEQKYTAALSAVVANAGGVS